VAANSASATTGDVVIVTSTGSTVTRYGGFRYPAPGVINSVSPSFGQAGSRVVISGQRLLGGGSAVASVTLAGIAVSQIDAQSNDTTVSVVAARSVGAVASGDVVIRANTGAVVTGTGLWSYLAPGVISTVSPASGQQGTYVVISGSGLLGNGSAVVQVLLAGVAATVTSYSDTQVNVTAGASGTLTGDVVIVSSTAFKSARRTHGSIWLRVPLPALRR